MTIEYIRGDLLASDEKFIGHGVNTYGLMGAGIAKAIADEYPTIYRDYKAACSGKRLKLGEVHVGEVPNWRPNDNGTDYRFVFNMATQVEPGPHAQYGAIMRTFETVLYTLVLWNQKRIGIPKIGCGIGGLQWDTVEWIIKELQAAISGAPHVAVYYL